MRRHLYLGYALIFAVGCAGISEQRGDRWSGPLDHTKAREIVREAFLNRAHPNPHLDQPIRDHEVVLIDVESIQFRRLGDPEGRRQVIYFRDVSSITIQATAGIPSRPETLIIHVKPGSESTHTANLRTDTLVRVGLSGPFLILPERDRRLVRHFKRAMRYLREEPLRASAGSGDIKEFVRYLEAEQRRLEKEELEVRKHEQRMERMLENR